MIFTFSATGNSYHAAKRISGSTGVPLVDLAAAVRYRRFVYDAKSEDVGFVFPVYFYGLPSMVKTLAENLDVRNAGHTYCVLTCGSESGAAGEMLAEALGKRLHLDAMYDVAMPDNAVFFEDPPSGGEKDRMLAEADEEISKVIGSVSAREKGDFRTHRGEGDAGTIYPIYDQTRRTESFWIADRCIECRICEEVCPEQIIKIYHRKPVWDEDTCSLCMSCLNLCPKQAIQFGDSTESRGRYHHPDFYERTIGIPLKY